VDSAQRLCAALGRTGDPVAARDLAIDFGFQFPDTATFVEASVAFFCPQLRSLVPQMSHPCQAEPPAPRTPRATGADHNDMARCLVSTARRTPRPTRPGR